MPARTVKIVAAAVAVVVALGIAVELGRRSVGSPAKTAAEDKRAATTTSTVPADFMEFRDDTGGWAMSYPKAWTSLPPKAADVVLVVSEKPPEANSGGSILVHDLPFPTAVTDANLAAAKTVTDKIVAEGGGTALTQPQIVHQGGLPGLVYFYSFKDPGTGQEGVHSHYFLFKGAALISVVFQALPSDTFRALAPTFDEVIGSFRVLS
ncbi:MAG TPA: hypothetical protein VFE55_03640 [Acidimicrobiia bacterium]|nr:hypothetical protein [Acidimicrobiia bacterium]